MTNLIVVNKADLGKIEKEKSTNKGILYLSEMLHSSYVVILEDINKRILISRMFPFTEATKKNQRRSAIQFFKKILLDKSLDELEL